MKYLLAGICGLLIAGVAIANNSGIEGPISSRASLADVVVTGTETDGGTGDCSFVTINITANVTGDARGEEVLDELRFSVFDDGTERDFEIVTVPVGSTEQVNVTLTYEGTVGIGAPGVGVSIYDGPTTGATRAFNVDPFFPDTVTGSCPGQPSPSVVQSVPVDSPWFLGLMALLLGLLAAGVIRSRA